MDEKKFLQLYVPALKQALSSENIDVWRGPEYYLNEEESDQAEIFMNEGSNIKEWVNFVDSFFDSRVHNFRESIRGISMDQSKEVLLRSIKRYELSGNSSDMMNQFKNDLRHFT